jgi:hypothetical protein
MQKKYFEPDLVAEINELRTNPKKYAEKLNKYLNYFHGNVLRVPGREKEINTEEGVQAYKEAIHFLTTRQEPLKPYTPSKGLCRIGIDFLKDIRTLNPEESRKADSEKIVDKYGDYEGDLARATDLGGEIPEYVVVNVLISDGDARRTQREALLSKDFTQVGVAWGKHDEYGHSTVIFTCATFENKVDPDDNGLVEFTPYLKEPEQPKPQPKPAPQPVKEPEKPKPAPEPKEKVPPKVVSESYSERTVTKNGKTIKYMTIKKTMSDGTVKVENIEKND